MIECSTCGNCVGHLYLDYYRLTGKLTQDLAKGLSAFSSDEYAYEGGTLGPFLTTYYASAGSLYEPGNVVARGLLRIRELKPEHLPFGRPNADGQRNQFEASICCLRMLQSDPSTQLK